MGVAGLFTLVQLRSTYRLVEQTRVEQLAPMKHVLQASADTNYLIAMSELSGVSAVNGNMANMQYSAAQIAMTSNNLSADVAALRQDKIPASLRKLVDTAMANAKALNEALSWFDYTSPSAALQRLAELQKDPQKNPSVLADNLRTTIKQLSTAIDRATMDAQRTAEQKFNDSRTTTIVALSLAVVLALTVGLLIASAIRRPLRRTVEVLQDVAGGDLTRRLDVRGRDEIGQMAVALNATLGTVHDVVVQLNADADRLAGYAEGASRQSATAFAGIDQISQELRSIQNQAEDVVRTVDATAVDRPVPGGESSEEAVARLYAVAEQVRLLASMVGDARLMDVAHSSAKTMADAKQSAGDLAEMAANLSAMIEMFTVKSEAAAG